MCCMQPNLCKWLKVLADSWNKQTLAPTASAQEKSTVKQTSRNVKTSWKMIYLLWFWWPHMKLGHLYLLGTWISLTSLVNIGDFLPISLVGFPYTYISFTDCGIHLASKVHGTPTATINNKKAINTATTKFMSVGL